MKKILLYIKKTYPYIPVNDKQAYQYYCNNNDVYNKLLLSEMQYLDCAPVGITPLEFPIIIKPIINLYGMSNGFIKINDIKDYESNKYIGMFWQKYLNGTQYNVDINMKNGKIIQYFCVISEPDIDGKFKYHYYYEKYILPLKIVKFIENLLNDYSGFLNIEIIDNYIIEMHLRLNGDLFLYSEKNIDDMVKYKKINVTNKCFFPIFIKKNINININITDLLNSLSIEYDIDGMFCNDYIRYCYFVCNSIEKGISLQKLIYEEIKNLTNNI